MNKYCPACGSIDIIAGRCQHCGAAAENQTGGNNYEKCNNVRHR